MPRQSTEHESVSRRRRYGPVRPRSGRADRAELEIRTLQAFRIVFGAARSQDTQARRIARLSASQLWALSEIAAQTGMTVNGLAERMALHQTTASNLVNALVERKLTRRVRDADDQRIVHLYVSAEGRRVLQRVPLPHSGILMDTLRQIPPPQLRALGAALQGLVARFRGAAPGASLHTLLDE
jgi:DNA-binding MarR family transcriptional regulator